MRGFRLEGKTNLHNPGLYSAGVGFDPVFGARPLKRAIERHLADPLAKELLAGRFAEGTQITVDAASNGEGLMFTSAVKHIIHRLRAKLGDPPVIHTVREGGYRIGDTP